MKFVVDRALGWYRLLSMTTRGYGQFCPVAKAAEILAERWTLLVLRDLLKGARHFNDLRRGLPLISPSVLAQRLKMLQEADIVRRVPASNGRSWEYRPTRAGQELWPLIHEIGHWGQRWVRSRLTRNELHPGPLM